ncbi:MAG: TIGR00270 family protein [Nanoarchaeota archaeon]|nr:TIGR00270 family protein [Nanoarchaeota archaeon]
MTACEMCGTDASLIPTMIEGVELKVCQKCTSYGSVVKRAEPRFDRRPRVSAPRQEKEVLQIIREDYPKLIKDKREKLGLKQDEFAKFLSEKESIIHKIESGTYTPSIDLARKIEKQLGISLIEEKEVEPQMTKLKKESFTIGDVLKIK